MPDTPPADPPAVEAGTAASTRSDGAPVLPGTVPQFGPPNVEPPNVGADPCTVPGYDILEVVGSGGMGVVFRARDVALDRDVAVKLLKHPTQETSAQRFLNEACITAQLQHPGIPPVHQV